MAFQMLKQGRKIAIAAMQCILQSSSALDCLPVFAFLAKWPILFLYCFSAED